MKIKTVALSIAVIVAVAGSRDLRAQDANRSVWEGVYTAAQADRGAPLYEQHCAACHGASLGGGESAPPLTGGPFMANWNGLTVGDLFERIRVSMPVSAPASLGRDTYVDILAYILKFNAYPAGERNLDRKTEMLKMIRIDPKAN